ncbi:MAG: DUF1311 domain-containing protein [Burkholderiaceae bacterium]|nr:DUF1311 domain-containing protein [Burkholderiaceae bacterium]
MSRRILVALAATLAFPLQAATQLPCADMSQSGMSRCVQDRYAAADADLNRVYKSLRDALAGMSEQRTALLTSQRAWLAFRDSHCAFVGTASEGGSAQSMVVNQCLEMVTRDRIKQLENIASCEEGDLSCPMPR